METRNAHYIRARFVGPTDRSKARVVFQWDGWPGDGNKVRRIVERDLLERKAANGARFLEVVAEHGAQLICDWMNSADLGSGGEIIPVRVTRASIDGETDAILVETRHREEI